MKKPLLFILFISINLLCRAQSLVLWGMTNEGGTKDSGIIFNYNTSTNTETTVHSFGNINNTDGTYPYGTFMQASNGLLYGMTNEGGAYGTTYGIGGTIFSYNIPKDTEIDIHDFGKGNDGIRPAFNYLIQATNGLLYGVTEWGGLNDEGTLFSYDISTGKDSVLYNFDNTGTDGYEPLYTLLQASNGLLYGTTPYGGVNNEGTLFSYDITTGSYTDLHDFATGSDGKYPVGALIQASNGLLYGMTSAGGTYGGAYGYGTIYSYDITTGIETVIHNFNNTATDGYNAAAPLVQVTDSLLYGMTYSGGLNDDGVIFDFNIHTQTDTDLHDFGNGTDGKNPHGSLYPASDGLLYGMTYAGGTNNKGILLSFNRITKSEIDLHDFGATADGQQPVGDLIEVSLAVIVSPISPGICKGNSVSLMASGATSYTWSPAAGLNTTTGDTVTASPTITTTYTIKGTLASNTYSATVTVTVNPNPTITVTSAAICAGDSATLLAAGAQNYTWSPAQGLSATTGDSVIAKPAITTTYTVTGIDSLGCLATGTNVVTIDTPPNKPVITLSATGDTLFSSAKNGNQWYRNDTLIRGATDSILVITGLPVDSYKVEVIDVANGCSNTSDSVIVVPTGINPLAANSHQLSIYPNPTAGLFTITVNGNQTGCILEIYNIMGEKIYQSAFPGEQNCINLCSQPSGVYFVYLESSQSIQICKVLLSR